MDRSFEDILVEHRRVTGHLNDRELLLVTLGLGSYNNQMINRIEGVLKTMATDQATFDAYITNVFLPTQAARDAAVQAEIAAANQAILDLQAKVQSGEVIDLTAELTQLQTLTANAQTVAANAAAATQTATSADPGPTNVAATPVTPAAPDAPAASTDAAAAAAASTT